MLLAERLSYPAPRCARNCLEDAGAGVRPDAVGVEGLRGPDAGNADHGGAAVLDLLGELVAIAGIVDGGPPVAARVVRGGPRDGLEEAADADDLDPAEERDGASQRGHRRPTTVFRIM